jgi:hypothetical protein
VSLVPVIARIFAIDEPGQPSVRLGFGVGLVMMVECLVRLLHRPERPLDLALGACGRARTVRSGRHVRSDDHVQALHYPLEHG